MNIPVFNAEASIYKTSTHYRLASGPTIPSDIRVTPSQLSSAAIPRTPIICNGNCPPPICHFHCGPCHKDSSGACVRTCTSFGPGCDDPGTSTVPCPADACCAVTCDSSQCTGGSCGTYPSCTRTPGSMPCHDCLGNPAPSRPC
jgi:hypothetical protein